MGISNTQYRDIMFQYDQTRMNNQRILDKRYETLFAEIPELEQIQHDIMDLSLTQARKELFQTEPDPKSEAEYSAKREALLSRKKALLLHHGYPEDYLQSIYTCPDCKDTGYQNNEPCHCLKNAEIKALYESSNLMDILNHENFDTFDDSYYDDTIVNENLSLTARQNIRKVKTVCLDYIKHFDDSYDNLIFYGSTGVGKTFLTHCIAKELLESAHSVIYFTSFDLFEVLSTATFGKRYAEDEVLQQHSAIFDCDLLIIDDLGTEMTNTFVASQLFLCINERLMNKKSTIISTNLSLESLRDLYSERVFSRISSNFKMRKLIGKDIRLMKKLGEQG